MKAIDNAPQAKILTVSELNRSAKKVLESQFPLFWVSGEISNFTCAASGHWYFSLKDNNAQVSCVMFRGRNSYVGFTPSEGDSVELRATVTLYEQRGSFQLTVEFIQKAGLGVLYETYERLKNKLQADGLFDSDTKLATPEYPKTVGIVTSPDAAALRDIITTLKRRNSQVEVIIYPTPVQGRGAEQKIANAIAIANQREEVDVLLICRGGGSIEDLWSFNEECVAQAIYACGIPTISGVGHETDVTICDFVADVRAPTPTAAAELACPDLNQMRGWLLAAKNQLVNAMSHTINQHAQKLDYMSNRLVSPEQQLQKNTLSLNHLLHRLTTATEQKMALQKVQVERLGDSLSQLNPNNVLARGYAMLENAQGKIITNASQVAVGEAVKVSLDKGQVLAEVKKKINKK